MVREFAKLQWSSWARRLPVEISLALAFGFVLALLGPYDTFRFPLLPRVGYWVGLLAAWFVAASGAELIVEAMLTGRIDRPFRLSATYIVVAIPMSALVWVASEELTHGTEAMSPLDLYWKTLLLGSGASLIAKALLMRIEEPQQTSPAMADTRVPSEGAPAVMSTQDRFSRLEQRLPRHLRSAVLALSSEDHYVRVHTAQGSHMVLMRLSDAIDELDGLAGERVHRSWWVAASAPSRFQTRGRTAVLILPGEIEVPISAPYLATAEAMSDRHGAFEAHEASRSEAPR